MNTSSHSSTDRIARPGDIFLLLVPTTHELKELRERQLILQSQYGGEIVDFVHITCERFSPNEKKEERICIDYLKHNVTALAPFTLYAAKIVQYYAPYWGEEVLRWQVQETDDYKHLRNVLAASLAETGCGSHFDRNKPTTCTALRLDEKIELEPSSDKDSFPAALFEADHLWISKLVGKNKFTILSKIRMKDQSFID